MYRLILFVLCVIVVNSFKYHHFSSSLRRYSDVVGSRISKITMAMTMTMSPPPKVINVDNYNVKLSIWDTVI